jgi:RNA polymerase sigma-70 factor (ECF subfamily)
MSTSETNEPRGGPSDAELLAAAASSPAAFEAFYSRHVDKVVGFCTRRLRDPEDVADVVANTFLAVLTSSGSYRPDRGDPGAWLIGIAARTIATHLRSQGRLQKLNSRVVGSRLLDEDDIQRIEDQIDAARVTDALSAALDDLSPRNREAILLVSDGGLTPAEAADHLGVARAAFRMRLAAARKALRGALREHESSAPAPPVPARAHTVSLHTDWKGSPS